MLEEHRHSDTLKRALTYQEEAFDVMSTPVEIQKVLQKAKHLNHTAKLKLGKVLNHYNDASDGILGMMPGDTITQTLKMIHPDRCKNMFPSG